jgi:hypothetical protein
VVGTLASDVYYFPTDRLNISPESDATTQDIQDALENILVLNEDLA